MEGKYDNEGYYLNPKELKAARRLEYEWIEKEQVIEAIPWEEAAKRIGRNKILG